MGERRLTRCPRICFFFLRKHLGNRSDQTDMKSQSVRDPPAKWDFLQKKDIGTRGSKFSTPIRTLHGCLLYLPVRHYSLTKFSSCFLQYCSPPTNYFLISDSFSNSWWNKPLCQFYGHKNVFQIVRRHLYFIS